MKNYFNLQLFAEEGAEVSPIAQDTETVSTDVMASADGDTNEPGNEEPGFDELIKGKYKKEYDAKVRSAINKRFKNQKDQEAKMNALNPLVAAMAKKYGMDASDMESLDIDALTQAIFNDNSNFEQEAFDKGIDVETYKQLKQMEAENARYKAEAEERARAEEGRAEYNELMQQGEELKQIYPGFDLDSELLNDDFGRLLATLQKSGFKDSVRKAYEVIHKDEILSQGMAYAVNRTATQISNNIQSRQRRPSENGLQAQAAASGSLDPSKLTREQIADLRKRAEKGERITFS